MIACTRTDPEDWDQDGRDYDREAFAQGFLNSSRKPGPSSRYGSVRKRNKHHTSMFGPRLARSKSTGIDQRDDNIRNGHRNDKGSSKFRAPSRPYSFAMKLPNSNRQ
jgi:hypothetical protein